MWLAQCGFETLVMMDACANVFVIVARDVDPLLQ